MPLRRCSAVGRGEAGGSSQALLGVFGGCRRRRWLGYRGRPGLAQPPTIDTRLPPIEAHRFFFWYVPTSSAWAMTCPCIACSRVAFVGDERSGSSTSRAKSL